MSANIEAIKEAITNRGNSHKAMVWEVFRIFEQAIIDNDTEKRNKVYKVLIDAFDSASDDITTLSIKLLEIRERG